MVNADPVTAFQKNFTIQSTNQSLLTLFAIVSLIAFESCKKDADQPAVTDLDQAGLYLRLGA